MNYKVVNRSLLEEFHPHLLPLQEYGDSYALKLSKTEKPVPQILIHERWSSLHSLYAPEKEFIEPTETCPVFLGMGGIYHLKEYLQKERPFVLLEPEESFFSFMIDNYDLHDLLKNPNILILKGMDYSVNLKKIENYFSPYLLGSPELQVHQRSLQLFGTSYSSWTPLLSQWVLSWNREISTQKKYSRHWFRNTLMNKNAAEKNGFDLNLGKKVMILGAGPSIEDNLNEILSLKKDFTLIAVDSIYPYLQAKKIHPDYVMTLDPQIISYLHYLNPGIEKVIMDVSSHAFPVRQNRSVFFCGSPNPLVQLLCPSLPQLHTALGNVSSGAVDLASQSGAEEIVLFGADFSYPSGKTHCRNTYITQHYQKLQQRTVPLEHLLYTFSMDGSYKKEGKIRSTEMLKIYESSLDSFLQEHPNVREFSRQNGVWKIILKKKESFPEGKHSNTALKTYRDSIENLPLQRFHDLHRWNRGQKIALSTLFPLSAAYLQEGPEAALNKARKWVLKQMDHLIS